MSKRKGSSARGYTARWQRYRKIFLQQHPLCRLCEQAGRSTPATVVDHKVAHRGNEELFWDPANHQPLCKRCHDSHKQRQERSGKVIGCDANGIPLSPDSHWNQ